VTIEVPVASGARSRPADADQEILETCLEVHQFSGREATLITGDTAIRIRAEAFGISAKKMPSQYLRRAEAATTD
jgi:predicted ribonuclease YlaK